MTTVRCIDCGFLSKRVRAIGHMRAHQGFFELEPPERVEPAEPFNFSPGDINAWQQGEYGCFKHKANFPLEIGAIVSGEHIEPAVAARRVLYGARTCASWCRYEPGVDPAGHLQELKVQALERDRRQFEETLAEFQGRLATRDQQQNTRLARFAIRVTIALGSVQLLAAVMAMTRGSIGFNFLKRIGNAICAAVHWLCN